MRQPKRQKQQEKLEDLIRDLERDLAEDKSQVAALEETYQRLEQSERLCQELAGENRRLAAEIAVWQERCARSEEYERELGALRRQLENAPPAAPNAGILAAAPAYAAQATEAARSWLRENRRVATGVAGVFVIALAAVVSPWRVKPERPERPPTPFLEPAAAAKSAPEAAAKPAPAGPRIRGVFQTIRPTRVYSSPSENSERVADIGKGTRVNVVDSQNGWLEIHSKHGRPPGFIRRDAAQRMAAH